MSLSFLGSSIVLITLALVVPILAFLALFALVGRMFGMKAASDSVIMKITKRWRLL